jgi:hypothetical protein
MTNPFAVATVTATFAQLLGRVIEEPSLSGATVTTSPPDVASGAGATRRLNLYLYHVTPSAALRNMDLPVRRSDGQLTDAPVTAVELHYLVTAFGLNDDELDAHHLMAHAMSLVNDDPVLTPDTIAAAIAADPSVAGSDLPDQVELVRLCPESLSVDDLSKVWGLFPDTGYRLSVGYSAAVLLIQRQHATTSGPPVHRPGIHVMPLRRPVIESLSPIRVRPGDTLAIEGRNLRADDLQVVFGGDPVVPVSVTDRRITLTVPADHPAGMTGVRVVHRLAMGEPPLPHRGFESNVAACIIVPKITTPTPVTVAHGATLTLAFEPAVSRTQRLSILIGDREVVVTPDDIGDVPVTTMGFHVPSATPTGTYLLRLRIDGSDSLLDVDGDPNHATFDQFIGPHVTVT